MYSDDHDSAFQQWYMLFLLGHILQSPSANVLPTLPFHVLRALFSSTPLTTDDGVLLRRMALEIGAIHLILACLSALSHHAPRNPNASTNVSEVHTHTRIVMIFMSAFS